MFMKSLLPKVKSIAQFSFRFIKKRQYAKSYKLAAQDKEVMAIAEEGMEGYLGTIER
jgi:hypothetical protein